MWKWLIMIIQHAFNYAVWMRFRMNWNIQIGKWEILAFRDYFNSLKSKMEGGCSLKFPSPSSSTLFFLLRDYLEPHCSISKKPNNPYRGSISATALQNLKKDILSPPSKNPKIYSWRDSTNLNSAPKVTQRQKLLTLKSN